MKRILIDGRPLTTTSAGITNFLKCCITEWAKLAPEDIFYIALPKAIDYTSSGWTIEKNMKIIIENNIILQKMPNLIWLNIIVPQLAKRYRIDIYFSALPCYPYFLPKRTKKVIVVHDVVNIEYKNTMQLSNIIANKLFFKRSIKNADILWSNSNYTKSKIIQYFPDRKSKEIFVGDAAESIFKQQPLTEKDKLKIKMDLKIEQDFILFVGSLEPRKNLSFLLQLMPELYKRTNLQLVIVGAKKWKNSQIRTIIEKESFPRKSVVFCNFVSIDTLVNLYNLAKCYVSTSLNEGFGMPQLEALLCGCPVVTAHNSAMIEVAKGKTGAYTVEGYKPEEWINKIITAINSGTRPNKSELKKYNWNNILKKFIFQYLK